MSSKNGDGWGAFLAELVKAGALQPAIGALATYLGYVVGDLSLRVVPQDALYWPTRAVAIVLLLVGCAALAQYLWASLRAFCGKT